MNTFFFAPTAAVDYANAVLADILNNIANANVEQLLIQSEAILEGIKNRNFNEYDNRARDELRDAEDCEYGMLINVAIVVIMTTFRALFVPNCLNKTLFSVFNIFDIALCVVSTR